MPKKAFYLANSSQVLGGGGGSKGCVSFTALEGFDGRGGGVGVACTVGTGRDAAALGSRGWSSETAGGSARLTTSGSPAATAGGGMTTLELGLLGRGGGTTRVVVPATTLCAAGGKTTDELDLVGRGGNVSGADDADVWTAGEGGGDNTVAAVLGFDGRGGSTPTADSLTGADASAGARGGEGVGVKAPGNTTVELALVGRGGASSGAFSATKP